MMPSVGGHFALRMGRFWTARDTCVFRMDLVLHALPDTYRFALKVDGRDPVAWERVLQRTHEYFIEPVELKLGPGAHPLVLRVVTPAFQDSAVVTGRCPDLAPDLAVSSLWLLTPEGHPNPLHRYGWQRDTLVFYMEVYTSPDLLPDTGVLMALVADTAGNIQAEMKPVRVPLRDWRTPLRGKLSLRSLEGGDRYTLTVVFQKGKHRKVLRTAFQFEPPPLSDTLAQALATFLPEEDRGRFHTLSRVQKIFFLQRRLAFLSPEVFSEFQERLAYVREHFREPGKAPYLTDRGRIYLLFGPPDRRLFYAEMRNFPPQEHWYYYNPSMAFVFVDANRTGIYRLAYSTEPQIPVTPGLERWIYDEEGLLPRSGP